MGDIVALQIFFNYYNSVKSGFKFLPRKQDRPVLNREQDSPAVNVMPPMKLWSGDGRRRRRDACPCALATALAVVRVTCSVLAVQPPTLLTPSFIFFAEVA